MCFQGHGTLSGLPDVLGQHSIAASPYSWAGYGSTGYATGQFGMLVQPLRPLIVQLKQSLDPHIPWVGVCFWPNQNPGEAE